MVKNCLVDYTFKSKEELEKLHTKQLLNELDFIRRNPSECYHDWYCNGDDEDLSNKWTTCPVLLKYIENEKLIKSILATRPHIPNKKESKALRIAKKKRGI